MRTPLLLVMVFCGLTAGIHSGFAQTWTKTSAPNGYWYVASSADGSKLFAMNGTSGGAVYVSTNAGSTWTLASSGPGGYYWTWLVSSAEGSKLAAALAAEDFTATLYTSADSGASWIQATNAPVAIWTGIATSADGNKLAAVAYNGGIYTSTNSGSTWTATGAPGAKWWAIASSADGRKLAAAIYNGGIWVSANSGATWAQTGAPTKTWAAIASAADGKKLAAAANGPTGGGPICVSTNAGTTWVQTTAPITLWQAIASSADGSRLIAVCHTGGIYTSTNSGATWNANSVPAYNSWDYVASSADGNKLVAPASGGGIYTLQSTPRPLLSLVSASNRLALSWLVPSANFVLQQNFDLGTTNWAALANTPLLNLTNLQNEVVLSPTNSSVFFRLVSQ